MSNLNKRKMKTRNNVIREFLEAKDNNEVPGKIWDGKWNEREGGWLYGGSGKEIIYTKTRKGVKFEITQGISAVRNYSYEVI